MIDDGGGRMTEVLCRERHLVGGNAASLPSYGEGYL